VVEQGISEGLGLANDQVQAFRLDRDSFLIAVEYILFVAKRREHRFEIAWDLREDAENHKGAGEFPWAWSNSFKTGGAGFAVDMLPRDAEGRRRFYVDGFEWHENGVYDPGQLSVWSWQGSRVSLLFATVYRLNIEGPEISFDGRYFHIPDAERRTVSQSPSGERRIMIGPRSVVDLGVVSDTPLLDFVDNLLDRLLLDKPVRELASDLAITTLRPVARDFVKRWGAYDLAKFGFRAELIDWEQRGRKACLVMRPDGSDHDFTFVLDIDKLHGRRYVTKAKVVTDMACSFAYDYSGGPRPPGSATK
jgi:hypothetical protein